MTNGQYDVLLIVSRLVDRNHFYRSIASLIHANWAPIT